MRSSLLAGFALVLALAPSQSRAQGIDAAPPDGFVTAVRTLAAVPAQPEPARSDAIARATSLLRDALAAWDHRLQEQERSVGQALSGAPVRRAAELHAQLGLAFRTRGRFTDALREFDAALTAVPGAADVQIQRALVLAALGRDDEAGRAFRDAFTTDPTPVNAYYVIHGPGAAPGSERAAALALLTGAYARQSATTPASAPFASAGALPDATSRAPIAADSAPLAQAFAHLASGRFADALAALTAPAARTTNDTPAAHLARAQQLEGQNRMADARREYEAAVSGTLFGRSAIAVGIARVAQVEGDLDGAIAAFTRALWLDPNNAFVHEELASAYAADGRGDDALCEAMAALLIDPRDGQAHAIIGQVFLDAGRGADAIAALTRALDVAPQRYETHYALAQALTRLGRSDEAKPHFDAFEKARRARLDERRRGIDAETPADRR